MATEQQSPQRDGDETRSEEHGDDEARTNAPEDGDGKIGLDRDDEEQDFVDKSKIDFDPDEGLYSGTAVDGTSEIPGPHLDGESGELSAEDLKEEARKQAEEAGVDPQDTPAAKSSVARAAEQEREDSQDGSADGSQDGSGDESQDGSAEDAGK